MTSMTSMHRNTLMALLTCSMLFLAGNVNAENEPNLDFLWEGLGQSEAAESFTFEKENNNGRVAKKGYHWATYKQSYGIERLQIKFPKAPVISKEGKIVTTQCSKKKTSYSMIAAMPPIGGIDPKEAFPLTLANLCQHPDNLLGYKVSKLEGSDILDVTSQNHESNVIVKSRLIITKRNFYLLRTSYPAGSHEDHAYFLNSFSISY